MLSLPDNTKTYDCRSESSIKEAQLDFGQKYLAAIASRAYEAEQAKVSNQAVNLSPQLADAVSEVQDAKSRVQDAVGEIHEELDVSSPSVQSTVGELPSMANEAAVNVEIQSTESFEQTALELSAQVACTIRRLKAKALEDNDDSFCH